MVTTIPISIMKPMREVILNASPVRNRPIRPPMTASGSENKMANGALVLPKEMTMIR
ncbi:hypothetical protein D1872_240960 [compost metagenome]